MKILISLILCLFPVVGYSIWWADVDWCDVNCAYKYQAYSELSSSIYKEEKTVEGWSKVQDFTKQYCFSALPAGVIKDNTEATQECSVAELLDLHVSVFRNDKTTRRAIVFKGMGNAASIADVKSFTKSKLVPEQYVVARAYIQDLINNDLSYKDAIVTGHSLGGSLAHYIAKSFGMTAYTFNPASLNQRTLDDATQFYNQYYSDTRQQNNIVNIVSNNARDVFGSVSGYDDLLGTNLSIYVNQDTQAGLHGINRLSLELTILANTLSKRDKVSYIFDDFESNTSAYQPKAVTLETSISGLDLNDFTIYYRKYDRQSKPPLYLAAFDSSIRTNLPLGVSTTSDWREIISSISSYYDQLIHN